MANRRRTPDVPPACFAFTVPGLEHIAAEEIEQELKGEVKKVSLGQVVFRPPAVDRSLLRLRTVEDVFLLLWGSDSLTYKAEDLKHFTTWTAKPAHGGWAWTDLLQLHHKVRPKPTGKPTYHLVTQMLGEHGYRRVDALKALAKGMTGKLPASWRPRDEGADVEVWLTIRGDSAVCGLRLSDQSMRHRSYKKEHLPASLRPVVAAAMLRVASAEKTDWVLDPMCGAGTILAERLAVDRFARTLGGDIEAQAVRAALANVAPLARRKEDGGRTKDGAAAIPSGSFFIFHPSSFLIARWDACQLPFRDGSIPCIVCNLPFGKQLEVIDTSRAKGRDDHSVDYTDLIGEFDRVLRPAGRAVLLVSDIQALDETIRIWRWRRKARYRIRILGQQATIGIWEK
jgi:SAM-dependent methyltransferase